MRKGTKKPTSIQENTNIFFFSCLFRKKHLPLHHIIHKRNNQRWKIEKTKGEMNQR